MQKDYFVGQDWVWPGPGLQAVWKGNRCNEMCARVPLYPPAEFKQRLYSFEFTSLFGVWEWAISPKKAPAKYKQTKKTWIRKSAVYLYWYKNILSTYFKTMHYYINLFTRQFSGGKKPLFFQYSILIQFIPNLCSTYPNISNYSRHWLSN